MRNSKYLIVADNDDHVYVMSGPGEVLSGRSQMCTDGQRGKVTQRQASDWLKLPLIDRMFSPQGSGNRLNVSE